MAFLVLLVLVGVPVGELWLMIEIGAEIGALATVALILATAAIGMLLFRVQGLATLRRVQADLARDEMPVNELMSGFGLLLAGLLLLVPGFATDALGFVLFIPLVRRTLARRLLASLRARGGTVFTDIGGLRRGPGPGGGRGGGVIDGEFEDVTTRESDAEPGPDQRQISDPHNSPHRH